LSMLRRRNLAIKIAVYYGVLHGHSTRWQLVAGASTFSAQLHLPTVNPLLSPRRCCVRCVMLSIVAEVAPLAERGQVGIVIIACVMVEVRHGQHHLYKCCLICPRWPRLFVSNAPVFGRVCWISTDIRSVLDTAELAPLAVTLADTSADSGPVGRVAFSVEWHH
jgi:hypothetical protein